METKTLLQAIRHSATATEALQHVERISQYLPLSKVLAAYMAERENTPQLLAQQIEVERSTLYRLLSGERLTTRNVLLRIALALDLDLECTQLLLQSGQRAELYPLVRRDALIIYCINHRLTLAQAEAQIQRKNEASLFERK